MTVVHALDGDVTEADLRRRVGRFLASQHFSSMRKLGVVVFGGTVILDGYVSSFHERQVAVAVCKRVAGVRTVIDRLIVSDSSSTDNASMPVHRRLAKPYEPQWTPLLAHHHC